jgi:hypothetical protein
MTRLTLAVAFLTLLLPAHDSTTPDQAKDNALPKELVGSWRIVSRSLGQEERKAAPGEERLLHITPTHMTRIVFYPKTRKLAGVVGGSVAIAGGKYVETIQWADEASRMGKDAPESLTFDYKLEKNQLRLELMAAGQKYVELWQRVE